MTTFLAPLAVLVTAFFSRLLLLVRAVPAPVRLLARTVLPPPAPDRSKPDGGRAWATLLAAVAARVVLRLVAPPACAACDAPSPPDEAFCPTCAATVVPPLAVEPLALIACGSYGGALAVAVRRLKYRGRPDLARPLGALLGAAVTSAGLRADLVVPVPLHPRKLRERGYNQSALLAGFVARAAGARLSPRGLVRTRDTAPQASLSKRGRRDNIAGAFRARSAEAIHGKRVVLVDDVATTGSTLRACASALLDAGAASVTTIVLARAAIGEPRRRIGETIGET